MAKKKTKSLAKNIPKSKKGTSEKDIGQTEKAETNEYKESIPKVQDWKKDKVLIYSIIGFLIVISAFVYYIRNHNEKPIEVVNEKIYFNGYTFEKLEGGIWQTDITIRDSFKGWEKDYRFLFHYTPYEVMDIPTIKNTKNESVSPILFINAQKIYITFDPDQEGIILARIAQSGVELAKIISQVYEQPVKSAITQDINLTLDTPIITCANVSKTQKVIYIKLGNTTQIFNDGKCLVIQGTNETEILRAAERASFELLKIL